MINKSSIKISIVLPSYNRSDMISKTIESCLNQTHKNIELIIVDDCSSDNSVEIIKQYAKEDSRIKFIQNSQNKKLPATLNVGFANAVGEYFTWISDDNLFAFNALEVMLDAIESNKFDDKSKDIGLVYANYVTINDEGKEIAHIYQESPEYLPIRDCVGACFLYRASVAKEVGEYNEKLFLIEDYEFFLRMGLKTKLLQIPDFLYYYRVHQGALTQSRALEIKYVKQKLKKQFLDKYEIPSHLRPISDLYMWFISDKSLISYIKLAWIITKNPITTLSYIFKNLRRFKK